MPKTLEELVYRLSSTSRRKTMFKTEIEALNKTIGMPLVRPGLIRNEYERIVNPEDPKLYFCEDRNILMPKWDMLNRDERFMLRTLYTVFLHNPLLQPIHGSNILVEACKHPSKTPDKIKVFRLWHKYWFCEDMDHIRQGGFRWRSRGKPLTCVALETMSFKCFKRLVDRAFSLDTVWYDPVQLSSILNMTLDQIHDDSQYMDDPVIRHAVEEQYRINRSRR